MARQAGVHPYPGAHPITREEAWRMAEYGELTYALLAYADDATPEADWVAQDPQRRDLRATGDNPASHLGAAVRWRLK